MDSLGNPDFLSTRLIFAPLLGQIPFAIDEGMPPIGDQAQKNAHLTMLDLACGAAVLPPDARRVPATFGKTGLIEDSNGPFSPQLRKHVSTQLIAHPIGIPDRMREQALHACATEARFRLLQECNPTGIVVGKAAPDLQPKGLRGQQHGVKRPDGLST